jgi:hypothetical protein
LIQELGRRVEARANLAILVSLAALLTTWAAAPVAGGNEGTTRALHVTFAPTPPLDVQRYVTSGSFPQVLLNGETLASVNEALKSMVTSDQATYAVQARQEEARASTNGMGTYETTRAPSLISASTSVTSVLVPVLKLYPGGNDGSEWLSSTIEVPTGEVVQLSQVLNGRAGLEGLAAHVKTELRASNRCVAASLRRWRTGPNFYEGLAADSSNYRTFALLPSGFAIGFPIGQVGYPTCNRVEVTVPYSKASEFLSPLGRSLVTEVRAPIV